MTNNQTSSDKTLSASGTSKPEISISSADSLKTDLSNPFFTHHSDHPGLVLVSKPLNGDNYSVWKRAMTMALNLKNKLGFVNGRILTPSEETDPNGYATWSRCNDMVHSWIINALSPELSDSVIYYATAHEVWEDLCERFSQSNAPRIFEIQRDITYHKQEQHSVSTYYTKLKGLWDELASYSDATNGAEQDQQKLMQFLMGLNDSYSAIRGQILLMNPLPSVRQAYSSISQEEKQRLLSSTHAAADKLPWIMGYNSNKEILSSLFYLYEPSQKRRYRLDNEILVGVELHASRFGWLLLSKKTKSSTYPHSFFFYCPFTGEIIQLPELDMGDANRATFSTAPTSSDCVIFVISIHLPYLTDIDYKFCVSTCSPGDTTWRCNLQLGQNFGGLSRVAYANGVLYCAFHSSLVMGAYNHALQEWKVHPYTPVFKITPYYYYLYLIESPDDGNLILLSKHYTDSLEYCVNVFRFDQSQMKWYIIENFTSGYSESHDRDDEQTMETENLNQRMLFYNGFNGLSLAAEGEASELANTVHEASMLCVSRGSKGESCPQIYDWVVDDISCMQKIWIQHPHTR